jgi:hypothetical protein
MVQLLPAGGLAHRGIEVNNITPEEDKRFSRASQKLSYILVGIGLALFLAISFANQQNIKDSQKQLKQVVAASAKQLKVDDQERKVRTDQACNLFERLHHRDVSEYLVERRSIVLLTNFVNDLSPEEREQPFNKLIISNIPQARKDYFKEESEASIDIAPAYCDEPGVGLKEPDPCVPGRPELLGGDGTPIKGRPCTPVS